ALVEMITGRFPDLVHMGALTIISNIYGNPAVSIPAGTIGGLPVGMQVLGRHHEDALLFDVALAAERAMPWPLVAPAARSDIGRRATGEWPRGWTHPGGACGCGHGGRAPADRGIWGGRAHPASGRGAPRPPPPRRSRRPGIARAGFRPTSRARGCR